MKWIPLAAVVFVIVGCSNTRDETKPLTLATTTSTRDSGLLKVLISVVMAIVLAYKMKKLQTHAPAPLPEAL